MTSNLVENFHFSNGHESFGFEIIFQNHSNKIEKSRRTNVYS